jgi:hypothetical protein
MLGQAVTVLAATVLLTACGGGSKAPSSSSGSPTPTTSPSSLGTPVVVFGGPLGTTTPREGPQKGHTLPDNGVTVHVTGRSLLFVVLTSPKTAVFRCAFYALPQQRKVPIHVAVTSTHGFKTYRVRPSKPLTPGPYVLRFGGKGRFQMSVYEPDAD